MSHELIPTEAEEATEGKAEQTTANEFIEKVQNILFKKDSIIMNGNEDNDALNTSILRNSNAEDNNSSSIAPRIPNSSPRKKYDQMASRRKSYNKQFSRGDYTPYSLDNSSSSPGDNTPYSPGDYTPFNNNNTPSMAHKRKYTLFKEKWGIEESGFDSPANSQDGDTSTHMARKQRIQMISQIGLVDLDNEDHIKLIVEILKQKSRSSRELSFLRKAISYLSLFQNNPELLKRSSASQSIFSEFNYQFCQKNEVIFNQGDFGYTYYILLKGSVYLLIPKLSNVRERKDSTNRKKTTTGHNLPQSSSCISIASAHFIPTISKNRSPSELDEENNNFAPSAFNRSASVKSKPKQSSQRQILIPTTKGFQQEVEQNFSSFHRNNRVNTTEDQEIDNEEDNQDKDLDVLRNYEGFNLVKTFVAGEAFGEISLITKQRRTGTMVCREDSHLMTLTKLGFDKIMGSYHERIKTERLGFLRNFSFLKDIPESNLLSLLLDMRIKMTPSKAVNFTQGSSVEDIFFLKTGIVQLSRTYEDDDEEQEQQQQQQLKSGIFPDQLEKIQALNVATQKLKNKKKQKTAIIATLKDNSHFGLEDVLKEIKNPKFKSFHSMTAEVISETAELYILDKNIFLNNIGLFNSTDMFVEEIKKKLAYYANREKEVRETNKSSQLAMNRLLKLIAGKRQADKNKEEQDGEEEQDIANEDFADKEENTNSINNKNNNRLNLSRSIHSPKKLRESKQKEASSSPLRYIQQQQQQRQFQQLQLMQLNQQQQSQNPLQSPVLPFKNILQQQQSLHQRQSFNFLDFVGTRSNCGTPLRPSDKTDFQKYNDKRSTQPQLVNYHPHPQVQPSQISSNNSEETFSATLKLPILDQNEYYKQEGQMRASLLQEFSSKSCVSHRRQLMIKHCENDSFAERTNMYKSQILQNNSTSRRTSRTGLTADPHTARTTTTFVQGDQQNLLPNDLGSNSAGDNTVTVISTASHNKKLQLVLRDDKKRIKEMSEMSQNIHIQNQAEHAQKIKIKSRKSVKSSIDLSRIDINMFRINGSTSHRSPKTTHYSQDKRYSSCVNNGTRRQSNDNVGQNLVNFLSSRESVSRLYEDYQNANNDGQIEIDKELSFQINRGNTGKSIIVANSNEKEPQIRGNSCMLTGCNSESQNEDQLNLPEQRRRVIIIRSRFDEVTQKQQQQQQPQPYSDNKSHSQSVSVNTSRTNIQLPSNLRVPANLHTLLLQNTPKPVTTSALLEIKTSQSSKAFNMHVQRAKKATQVPAGAAKMLLNQQSKLLLNKHDAVKLAQNPLLLLQPSPP